MRDYVPSGNPRKNNFNQSHDFAPGVRWGEEI